MADNLLWSSDPARRSVHPRDAAALVGTELFVTDWRRVDREHLDGFHWSVDEVDTASDTTANDLFPRADENVDGFMLLSLVTSGFFNNYPVGGDGIVAWNYGVEGVRFPATVYLENEFRMRVRLDSVERKPVGWLLRNGITIEMRDSERPAMVGTFLVMLTSSEEKSRD